MIGSWATLNLMRATPVLLLLVPCAIAANQPTFTYAVPANTTVAAMAVDAAGNTYLTGSTTSSSFPATAGALQTQFSGGTCGTLPAFHGGVLMFPCTDAFVIKLDPAGNVLFATYFGGNGSETAASAICVDASGNVYLGGTTGPNSMGQPDTFPVTAGAAFTNSANDGGFVAKLNAAGTALVYSTLLPMAIRSGHGDRPRGRGLHRRHKPRAPCHFQRRPARFSPRRRILTVRVWSRS